MAEKQSGWGRKVMGLFVESDDPTAPSEPVARATAGDDAADDLIRRYAGGPDTAAEDAAGGPPPAAVELRGPVPAAVGGQIDFEAVYESAGVGADRRERIQKARELLRSLPAETPVAVKRQIVEAALKAFGVPTSQIIEAATAGLGALDAFVRAGQNEAQKLLSDGAQRIAELEAEITSVRQIMQQAVAEQEERARASTAEKASIQEVLGFFGVPAGPSAPSMSPAAPEH